MLGDVHSRADIACKSPVGVESWCAAVEHPSVLAVVPAYAVLHPEAFTTVERLFDRPQTVSDVVGMHRLAPTSAELSFERTSRELQPSAADVRAEFVGPRHPEHDRRAVR